MTIQCLKLLFTQIDQYNKTGQVINNNITKIMSNLIMNSN